MSENFHVGEFRHPFWTVFGCTENARACLGGVEILEKFDMHFWVLNFFENLKFWYGPPEVRYGPPEVRYGESGVEKFVYFELYSSTFSS